MAGRPPFEAETAEEVAKRHLSDRPPPLRTFCPDSQEQTVYALDKSIARNIESRWPNYNDLSSYLGDALRRL
jgi:hypothetical protein